MKIYTFYTSSHKELYEEWFLPSLKETNPNLELITRNFDQECLNGDFMADGWMTTMHKKIDLVIEGIKDNWGTVFIHSDCDIQFFGDIEQDIVSQMGDADLCGIDDIEEISCGFFICRGNEKTLSLFQEVKKTMGGKLHDQYAMNMLRDKFVNSKKLDEKYYCIAHSIGKVVWEPGIDLEINNKILVHHANWIVGVSNKLKNLEVVKSKVNQLV